MTKLKIWTVVNGRPFDEGILEIKPMVSRPDLSFLVFKDGDKTATNEVCITVDADAIAAIIKVLQDRLDEVRPDLDPDDDSGQDFEEGC